MSALRHCARCASAAHGAASACAPAAAAAAGAAAGRRAFSLAHYDLVDLTRRNAAVQVPRPPKRGSRRAAEVQARVLQIQAGLAGQEKRVADYKKTLPPKLSNRGLLYLVKANSWEK